MIEPEATVAAIARDNPSTILVFQRHQIDFCCGGGRPLAAVCAERGLAVDRLLAELEAAGERGADEVDWNRAPLAELVDHVVRRYHGSLRRELPLLSELAAKVADRHGDRHPELAEIRRHFETLRSEMVEHMAKEEQVLFPFIVLLERRSAGETAGAEAPVPPLDGPIAAMEDDHDRVAWTLARLRGLSDEFTPPASACNSYRGLFQGLADLEADTHVHVHLENNVLFPRAQALAAERAA